MSKALAYKSVLSFDGVNDTATATLSGNVTKLRMWIDPSTTTQHILYFDTSASKELTLSAGVFAYSGVETLTVTVLTGSISEAWFEVEIEFSAPLTVTSITFGRTSTTFYNGLLADLQLYGTAAVWWKLNEAPFAGTGFRTCFPETDNKSGLLLSGVTWMLQSGKENGETHSGLPQSIDQKGNLYSYLFNNAYRLTGVIGLLPFGSSLRTISISYIHTATGFLLTSGGTAAGEQFNITIGTSTVQLNFGGSSPARRADFSHTMLIGNVYLIDIIFNGTTVNDWSVNLDGTPLTRTFIDGSATVINTTNTLFTINNNSLGALFNFLEVYSDATKTTKTHSWANLNQWVNTVGADNLTPFSGAAFKIYAKVPEDSSNLGFDLFGNALELPDNDVWMCNGEYIEFLTKQLNFNEGAILTVCELEDLFDPIERTIWDARNGTTTGLRLFVSTTKILTGRYNNTSVVSPSSLTGGLKLITFWLEASEMSLRIDGVEIARIAKSGSITSTTTPKIGVNYLKTSAAWKGTIGAVEILDAAITEAELIFRENRQMTRFGI